jgi:hypothetical protein
LSCGFQTARTGIKRLNEEGVEEALRKESSRPRKILDAFDEGLDERLRQMADRSPREFKG